MLCDDARLAANLLSERNFIVSVTPVVAVQVPDVPGGLDTVLRAINAAGIDIGYMYSSFGKTDGDAFMIFRVSDPDAQLYPHARGVRRRPQEGDRGGERL